MEERIKEIIGTAGTKINIFRLLDSEEINRIAEHFELVNVPANTLFLKEGDQINYLGIIASGKMRFERRNKITNIPILLAILEKGSHVGEFSMLPERETFGRLKADEDTELLIISHKKLNAFMQEHPHTGVKIMKGISAVLSIRLKNAIDRVVVQS